MSIIASAGAPRREFVPVSEGLHPAVCWAVIDMGIQRKGGMYPGEAHQVYLGFEVLDQEIEFGPEDDRKTGPMRIGITTSLSLHEKAKLRKWAEKWRGKPFTPEELKAFDVSKLAGQPCQILVTHAQKGDRTYANIENVLAAKDKNARATEVLVYSLDEPKKNIDQVPNWLLERIGQRLADNWREFNMTADDKSPGGVPEPVERQPAMADEKYGAPFGDDIPFALLLPAVGLIGCAYATQNLLSMLPGIVA